MTKKRFYYDWKTGRMKDTGTNWQATSDMRILETIINDACDSYERKIKKLEGELNTKNEYLKQVKYEKFKSWFIMNYSDIIIDKNIFNTFEKYCNK